MCVLLVCMLLFHCSVHYLRGTTPPSSPNRLLPHASAQVFDLQYASPATISRCGMVYVDSRNLGYQPFIWAWLNTRTKVGALRATLSRQHIYNKYVLPARKSTLRTVPRDQMAKGRLRAMLGGAKC